MEPLKPFNTEKEAQDKVAALNKNRSMFLKFCPLIKDQCNEDCVCYVPSRYFELNLSNSTYQYQVYEPHCGNAMFTEKEIYYNG